MVTVMTPESLKSPNRNRRAKVWLTEDQILIEIDRKQRLMLTKQRMVESHKDRIKELSIEIAKLEEAQCDYEKQGEMKLAITECHEEIDKAEKA